MKKGKQTKCEFCSLDKYFKARDKHRGKTTTSNTVSSNLDKKIQNHRKKFK